MSELIFKTNNFHLKASKNPWDEIVYQMPMASISNIDIKKDSETAANKAKFEEWLIQENIKFISARVAHDALQEIALLEGLGFNFIEMLLHPYLDNIDKYDFKTDNLEVTAAEDSDYDSARKIALKAFTHERFYMDPHFDKSLSHERYANWVKNTKSHKKQNLLVIKNKNDVIGFFIVELKENGFMYWHLTAIDPAFKGQGLGYETWKAVLKYHQDSGVKKIMTSITAGNIVVMNLYSKLNFRFYSPEVTFHYHRVD